MDNRNTNRESFFRQEAGGNFSVHFNGREVANELTQEQAGQLIDDLSCYGTPMYCIYNSKELCMQGEAICIRCPDRKEMEAGKLD